MVIVNILIDTGNKW